MNAAVLLDERGRLGGEQLLNGLGACFRRNAGVEPIDGFKSSSDAGIPPMKGNQNMSKLPTLWETWTTRLPRRPLCCDEFDDGVLRRSRLDGAHASPCAI